MDPNVDGATTFTDLPLAPEGRSWDGGAARSRLARWASSDGSGSKDKIDWPKYRKGFFWYDAAAPEELGSYKAPFADVIDGTAKAVWSGVSAAVQRLSGTDIPEADKTGVKSHARRYCRKFDKPFPEELSVDEADELAEQLEDAADLVECEELLDQLLDAHPERQELLDEAESKIETLKRQDREELHDEYLGPVEVVESLADGRLKVRAVIAQVDAVNSNQRLYPKDEMVKSLKRANRLAKRGALVGLDGHPGFFESGKAKDIVVRWDAFMLKDDDVYAEGTTVLTEAGKDVTTVWQSGVALEWSIRGYGKRDPVEKDGGEWSHDIIRDYVLDGADVVLRGAAKTKTVSLSVESAEDAAAKDVAESQSRPPEPEAEPKSTTMSEEIKTAPEVTEEPKTDAPTTPTADTKVEAPKPLDEEALLARLTDRLMPSVSDATTKAAESVFAANALHDFKSKLLEGVADEDLRKPLERGLAGAKTIEEAQVVYDEIKPMLERAMRPEPEYGGIGIITEATKLRAAAGTWVLDGKTADRPKTAHEAYIQLAESVEDTGGEHPKNKGWVWRQILDVYAKQRPEYLEAVTSRGIMDAATTTSAIGTYIGMVLPTLRQAFPSLIPFDIAAVWPMRSKQGTIPTVTYSKVTGGYSLSDSANFDSTYANQVEASAKAQITFSLTTRNVTAIDRALHIDLSTQVQQDMRAEYDIDVQNELIGQAASELARETNFAFIEMMLAQANAGNTTFSQNPPASTSYNAAEWRDRNVPAAIESVAQDIRDNRYRNPEWCIAGSAVYALLKTLKTVTLLPRDQIVKYGDGLSLVANMEGTMDVYLAAWLSDRSKAVFGYRPQADRFADAVAAYCPYVPLYVSQPDFTADTNTTKWSVSQRDAMSVLQPTGLGTLTIDTAVATGEFTFS